MFAQGWPDLGLQGSLWLLVRIGAGVGGAFVGWFLCDPLTRLLYRICFRGPTPGWLLPYTKLSGAIALGVLTFVLVQFGGGGGLGGWGFGGWQGKDGTAKGGNNTVQTPANKDNNKNTLEPKHATTAEPARETVEIEILGGTRLKDDRYFLVKKTRAELAAPELENYLKLHQARIKVKIIHSDESYVDNTDEDPTRQLQKLATKYDIYTQGPK